MAEPAKQISHECLTISAKYIYISIEDLAVRSMYVDPDRRNLS